MTQDLKYYFKTPLFFYVLLGIFLNALTSANAASPIKDAGRYFPDDIGLTWTYEGTIEEKIQQIATYTNMTTVKGTTKKDGVKVTIFTESNKGNQGPSESYFSRNTDSIVYHGGEPTTTFEEKLVPYLVMQFPLHEGESFIQVEKKTIPFGADLDQDGIEELAEVKADITVAGYETVSVPAGIFKDALKLNGLMTIQFTLSKDNTVVELTDKTTTWFALDLGMVKSLETVEFPEIGTIPKTSTVIKEVLKSLPEK
ncbi:hypothetical protein MNBD_NITROSPIRAE01-2084 [hydrothermal vent metagenome]|uniref:Uncharacterized protein n=1 Tax=hydrothermal vent metagenome TaxID=652676 RepID=A0A3B1D1V4_9ZZZZ